MLRDGNLPAVGTNTNMLGARIPGGESPIHDIAPDVDGNVSPDTGGISVARSFSDLLPHLIPKRLRSFAPDATGRDNRFIWSTGQGEFLEGPVAAQLYLREKPAKNTGQVQGLIEPDATMLLEDYQLALAATQMSWSLDEPA
jgi:hypothetical protein